MAEGFERGGNKEFVQFLFIAKGSCGELRLELYRAFDRDYLNKSEFDSLPVHAMKISSLLKKFITYLQESDNKRIKYKPNATSKNKSVY